MKKEFFDKVLNKLVSRKLTVFIVSCVGLFTAKIDGDNWIVVASIYIGAEVVTSTVERLFKAKTKKEEPTPVNEKG